MEYKIIILGLYAVGKTSLAMALKRKNLRCPSNKKTESTIGIDFFVRSVHNRKGEAKKLQIWDTAGQCEYDAICKSYYRQCDCAIIVFDLFNVASWKRAVEWCDEVRANDESIGIVLVGNKSDLVDCPDQLSVEQCSNWALIWDEATNFANEHSLPLIAASNYSGQGVQEIVFAAIEGAESHMRHEQMKRERDDEKGKGKTPTIQLQNDELSGNSEQPLSTMTTVEKWHTRALNSKLEHLLGYKQSASSSKDATYSHSMDRNYSKLLKRKRSCCTS